ncbi:hypothetical protein [Alkalibacterium olivapovliticus]|uniref:ComK protein n=1 Tax=Alkalibacterium olivapovliticus TaxID=99907 RepID=A0A2T0VTS8_9LACT|nr:hypothetical protein [Alkalibacterium olivapovliticus]PRY74536.1 hypothetical protein CLV38_1413 [Alkalibacterium olivapovliticus]
MDISDREETPYNSIMYQLNDSPKKSTETTTVIMNRYFDSQYFPYSCMKLFGESLGYKRSLPYILGETYFVPDRGTSKKPASWYALHHVANSNFNSADKKLTLFTKQHPILTQDTTHVGFEKQLNVASHLYFTQTKLVEGLFNHFDVSRNRIYRENLVHQRLERVSYQLPSFTAYDFFQFMTFYNAQKSLSTILGEDTPYLDEARSSFRLPKMDK